MKYLYQDLHGCRTEFDFPMGEAPAEFWDDEDGMMWTRVFTPPAVQFKGSGWASKS